MEAAALDVSSDGAGRDATEHLRQRLGKWTETAVEKVTKDMEALELHSAARNCMRLFDRIKDFEKRVLAREPELSPTNQQAIKEALAILAQLLAPMTPHIGEELWALLGRGESAGQVPWPGVSFRVPA